MKWRPIKDFEDYEVSNTGLIRKGRRLLKPFTTPTGYERIALTKEGISIKKLVHRLVAESFIPTKDYSLQVNHKDMNRSNNNVNNLEWVTCKENVNHAVLNNPIKRKQLKEGMSVIGTQYGKLNGLKSRKPVEQYSVDGKLIKVHNSAREASRELNISYKVISKCCNGSSKTYKGFIWKFASE